MPRPRLGVGVLRLSTALPTVISLIAWFSIAAPEAETPIHVAWGDESPASVDPAAWGSDHVGQPVPEFVTGDECLFCHRKDVGPTWSKNRHQLTVRAADADSAERRILSESPGVKSLASKVEFLMGYVRRTRFLKRGKDYGTLSMLSVEYQSNRASSDGIPVSGSNGPVPDANSSGGHPLTPNPSPTREEGRKTARLLHSENPHWDDQIFGRRCAGCHATGVDAKTHAFVAVSLDCYVCHGNATLDHSKDTSKMILSKSRHDDPRVVISICGQCHIRTGKSRSTGMLFANNFVAGDNLFRDLEVDLSDAAIAKLNPADRHVLQNVREVLLYRRETVTCLSCHEVHKQSSRMHHRVAEGVICLICHNAEGPKSRRPKYDVHSPLCEY